MSLNKDGLKENIKALLEDMMTRDQTSIDDFAELLSNHIDTYVKTATIKYNTGLVAGGSPVTGVFNGQLE